MLGPSRLFFLVITATFLRVSLSQDSPYTYKCQEGPEVIGGHEIDGRCVKMLVGDGEVEHDLNGCKMTCGKYGTLWPQPTGTVKLSKMLFDFLPTQITLLLNQQKPTERVSSMFEELKMIFKTYLHQSHPRYDPETKKNPFVETRGAQSVEVKVNVESDESQPFLGVDESYVLKSKPRNKGGNEILVEINAKTYFGARHAIETLSQMIQYNENTNTLQMHKSAHIEDSPKYPHRGLLLDTSRNYFGIPILRRMVDALSYNKMNVLHWHITDTHSFPLQLESIPELAKYGAYAKHKVYSPQDVKDLVEYGRIRGVKILPEFDAPAHVGNGWQYAEEKHPEWGRLAVCVNKEEWQDYCVEPPCGQFNVVNDKMYDVLGMVYKEMLDMFDTDMFHMGGDEVNFNCWNTSVEIKEHLKTKGLAGTKKELLSLWGDFQRRAFNKVIEGNNKERIPAIYWTNSMTEDDVEDYLTKDDYIIQFWSKTDDHQILDIINKGYRTIYSPWDKYYLDCGYSSWVGEGNNWCTPYKGWQLIYDTSPRNAYKEFKEAKDIYLENILGGEVAMWSEQVEGLAVEGKVWPRGAALGERLWADPEGNWKKAEFRFLHQRERMVSRGISADGIQPEWCHQNEGLCYVRVTDNE